MNSILLHMRFGYPCWYRRDVVEILRGQYVLQPDTSFWAQPFYQSKILPVAEEKLAHVTSWDYCIHHNAGLVRDDISLLPDRRHPQGWHLGFDKVVGGQPWDHVRLCKYGSGLNCMMQQAYLEGYNPIILLGCDLGFKGRERGAVDQDHFDPQYSTRYATAQRAQIDNETHVDFHQHAKDWCDKRGVQILNATVGGNLEVYPRVRLEELV